MDILYQPSQKNSPLLLSTPTWASSCNTISSQTFVNTSKPAWQRGSANPPETPGSQNRALWDVLSQRAPNPPQIHYHNPGKTLALLWANIRAGIPSQFSHVGSTEAFGCVNPDPSRIEARCSALLVLVIIWTLQDPPVCSTQVQPTDIKKVILLEKWTEWGSLLWKTTHYFNLYRAGASGSSCIKLS